MSKIENDVYVNEKGMQNAQNGQIVPMLRLTFRREEKFFGPGVSTLLHLIDQKGSIQAACEEMGMSYSKAWKILKRASAELGFPLLLSQNGGAKGGESRLSEEASIFLKQYDHMTEALKLEAERLFEIYFGEYQKREEQ